MKLKLPYIPRIISATVLPAFGNFILWMASASLIGYNLFLVKTKPISYVNNLLAIFHQPFSAVPHEQLAKALWVSGARGVATKELSLAADLSPDVLGVTRETSAKEAATVQNWQDTVTNHPDYRDGYIQLAFLSYARGDLTKALTYLRQAEALDPNNELIQNFVKFISSLQR